MIGDQVMGFSEKYQDTMTQLLAKVYYFNKEYKEHEDKNSVNESLKNEFDRVREIWKDNVPKATEIKGSDHKMEIMETRVISLLNTVITNMDNFIQKYGENVDEGVPTEVKELLRSKRADDYDEDFTLYGEYNHDYEQDLGSADIQKILL
jgi:triphosphoribosyl-dephospho-CoA synthetase